MRLWHRRGTMEIDPVDRFLGQIARAVARPRDGGDVPAAAHLAL